MFPPRWRSLVAPTLLICILLYAALLRLDALFKSYGPYDQPRWIAAMEPPVTAAASTITPDWRWRRDTTPYVGGDPINYLKFAREMRNFYAAHVREPMFPALTRIGLMLAGGADVGISLTSIAFALLTLVATYALGSLVASPMVGLAAAAMLGIDHSAVYWSIGGWRDELFAFFAVSCTWAWVQFARQPTRVNAVLAGVLSGGACLTRITTIALIAPAVFWLLTTSGPQIRRPLALAVGIAAVILAPFLISCAIATGDPFYSINNHTDFYLKRERAADMSRRGGTAAEADVMPISAVAYSFDKFEARPIAATDNAVRGVFVYPFANKWVGLDYWYPGLGTVLACLAIAGLLAWLWLPDGRLLLVMFLGSLVPFSMTWTVLGGAEWRLTLFAYPIYLIAAFCVLDWIGRVATGAGDAKPFAQITRQWALRTLAVLLAFAIVTVAWSFGMPYAIVRETLQQEGAATIMASPRDRWFFVDGWSHLVVEGNVTMRFAEAPGASLRILLPEVRPYALTLRADPVDPSGAAKQIVRVSLNGTHLDDLALGWNPERIGEYRITIPAGMFPPGGQRLGLRSDTAFKLWYVRVAAL